MLNFFGTNKNAAEFVAALLSYSENVSLSITIIRPGRSVASCVFIATGTLLEDSVRELALSYLLEPMPTWKPHTRDG